MNKVFGIGMGRTATKSLTQALEILGLNVVHYPRDEATLRYIQNGHFNLPVLDTCDGITDTVAVPYYAQFDTVYPDSRFILTVREKENWLTSVRSNHNGESTDPLDTNPRTSELRKFFRAACWGTYRYNRDRYAFVFEQHNRNVKEYFKDRPDDLLVMDICAGQGWDVLCPFLGRDIPDVPFPRTNVTGEPAQSAEPSAPEGLLSRLANRLRGRSQDAV